MTKPLAEQDILALVDKSAATDIPLLLKAKEAAKHLVNEDPSAEHLRQLERVSKMLEQAMQKQNFTSTKEVLAHLQDRGLRVGKSKLYEDKRKGFLKAQADGTFTKRDVDKYAATLTSHALPDKELAVAQEYASRKAKAEAEKLEEQAKAERFKNDVREGKFIPRDDVEVELAARAGVLATGLRTAFETQMLDFIYLVGGDPKKAADLLLAYERQLDIALNEYSRPIAYDVSLEDFYENDDFGENED